MPYVLDTSFLVDLAHGHKGARELMAELAQSGDALLVPTTVAAEYLGGAKHPDAEIESLQRATEVQPFTLEDAKAAASIGAQRLAAGTFPGWPDVFIMGFTARHRATLVTADGGMVGDVPIRTYRS